MLNPNIPQRCHPITSTNYASTIIESTGLDYLDYVFFPKDYIGYTFSLQDSSIAYTVVGDTEVYSSLSNSMNTNTTQSKPNIIYFKNDHSTTVQCQGKIKETFDFEWTTPSTWAELAAALQKESQPCLAIHVDMLTKPPVNSAIEFMDALDTITKFMPCHDNLRVGVVITQNTPRQVIKDLQKTQCQGILLPLIQYADNEVNMAMNALYNKIPYWPKHILDELPGTVKRAKAKPGEIKLTPRQEQILNLIRERGASNKTIARILNITESTVKLHVGLVLKKFGVKNRTQLALFSKQ